MIEKTPNGLVKLRIVDDEVVETVWAQPLANDTYRLRNLLFFVYGYAFDDVVRAEQTSGEFPTVTSIVTRSGHSAYRVFLCDSATNIEDVPSWLALEEIGCTFERASENLYAIDVPPESDVYRVYVDLEHGESSKFWSFEEVFCGHVIKH